MTTLIVHLGLAAADGATEYAYAVTTDGRTALAHAASQAAVLPAADEEVVAVVPLRALSWHRVELPKGSTASPARLRAVLDGLLEDRLLDEPEALHFALEPGARAGSAAWVAACDRAWLRSHVQTLEAAGRRVARIVPEYAPDPDGAAEPTLHVLGEADDAWLVTTHTGGVIAMPFTPQTALAALHAVPPPAGDDPANDDASQSPSQSQTSVIAEPGVAALAEQLLGRKVTLRQSAQRLLLAARSPWDLAQFDFASTGRARAIKRAQALARELLAAPQWRPARWGLALVLLANLLGLNAWAWKEESSLAAKRAELSGLLTRTFTGVKVVVDAPVQMERELAVLRQSTGATSGDDLESMLGALATAAPPGRALGGIEFASGEARIKGLGLSAGQPEADGVLAGLRAQGFGGRFEGDTLVVRAASGGAAR